jgi:hypothetical protein
MACSWENKFIFEGIGGSDSVEGIGFVSFNSVYFDQISLKEAKCSGLNLNSIPFILPSICFALAS